jgi:para-nitrobenzyl esterase
MRNLFLAAAFLVGCSTTAPMPAAPDGLNENGVQSWLGIEYGRADRWDLPQRGPDWSPTGDFSEMGPACPQKGQAVMTEDCLYLNVFAPERQSEDGARPVLVWFHGGGFVANDGGDYVKSLTRDGIVAVSFNYRLGKLGFYDWAGWNESDPRNFGQADMVLALEWVQDNIARFGGDPDKVTIMGHSAGAMGVQMMMVDPRADGLFDTAIAHSGYAAWPFPKAYNPSDEERMIIRYAALPTDATPEDLVNSLDAFHLPYRGGSDLPQQPLEMFRNGKSVPVPYLAGANSYDGGGTLQAAGFEVGNFLRQYGSSPAIKTAYADDFAVFDTLAAERVFGDMRYAYSTRETARAHTGKSYLFMLDAPDPGRTHTGHYAELFGKDPSNFRRLIVDFIKNGDHPALPENGWLVLDPVKGVGTDPDLDNRLDALHGLEFPQP